MGASRLLSKSAIVESGSNANGSYTKWNDGTMVQWGETPTITSDTAYGTALFSGRSGGLNLPVAFIDSSWGLGASSKSATGVFGMVSGIVLSPSTYSVDLFTVVNGATAIGVWVATGRWK